MHINTNTEVKTIYFDDIPNGKNSPKLLSLMLMLRIENIFI